jgi:hypothetical protein
LKTNILAFPYCKPGVVENAKDLSDPRYEFREKQLGDDYQSIWILSDLHSAGNGMVFGKKLYEMHKEMPYKE